MSIDVDTRALLHGALNTAMMAAFQSEEGKPIGIGLAVLAGFIDVMFPKHSDPVNDPTATPKEVKTALDNMAKEVIDAIWKERADDVKASIQTLTAGFYNEWTGMRDIQVDTTQFILVDSNQQPLDQQTVSDFYTYFNVHNPSGVLTSLRQYRNTLQVASLNDESLTSLQVAEHQTKNIGLYGLIGGLTAAYLQAAVAWIWGRELLRAWQYQEFQQALTDWNTAGQPYPYSQLLQKFPGVGADPYYQPPDWNTFIDLPGSPVHLLIKEVQDMLDFCVTVPGQNGEPDQPGLYTGMWDDLQDFDTKMASYDVTLSASAALTKANMIAMVEQGTDRSGQWHALATKYARLEAVTEDNLVMFGLVIDQWRGMAATVRFKVHVTVPGDTIESLCTHYYGDIHYAINLVFANKGVWTGSTFPKKTAKGHVLAPGLLLKIFEVDAFPYVLS